MIHIPSIFIIYGSIHLVHLAVTYYNNNNHNKRLTELEKVIEILDNKLEHKTEKEFKQDLLDL
jgi:hypothetical protein